MSQVANAKIKLFLLAGEASGDQIGADLIAKMRQRADLKLEGVGGANMATQGLHSLYPITDLSVMGYVDVILRLPLLLWRVRQTVRAILNFKPDIIVLIDSQVFSNLVAKGLKKKKNKTPIILYVAPTVWGYKPERARHIKPLYDEVLAILPYEPEIMAALEGPPCRYVGHPALTRELVPRQPDSTNNIILMPGSRTGELRRHLPMFETVVTALKFSHPELTFTLLTLPHLKSKIAEITHTWKTSVKLVSHNQDRAELFSKARMALTVAGTATLELGVAGVPMVVIYIMDIGQRQVKKNIDIKYFSLPNLILDEALVPEILLEKSEPDQVITATRDLLDNQGNLATQVDGFARMKEKMQQGTKQYPRMDPAICVLSHLPRFKKTRAG